MLCKRNPEVTSIEQHILMESHQNKIFDRTAQNKFKRFHDTWMRLDASVQIHQKYFHRTNCIPCNVQVFYETIIAHVSTNEHQRNITIPFLGSESEQFSDSPVQYVTVPSTMTYNPITCVPIKTQSTSNVGSPIKEISKNSAASTSLAKAGM